MNEDTNSLSQGPCTGYRIVDMSSLISGPFCSQILCDLGAEVIKIESPGSDAMRTKYPRHNGMGALFQQVNRGKKSVTVAIKTEEGRKFVHDLIAQADVFVQNSRPGVMERLGFGYEEVKRINDKIIYLAVSGFGETGPYANHPAYDMVIQGLTGFMPFQGGDNGPQAIRSTVADKITAMWAANATLAALLHRERTGEGQKVSVNMASAYSAFILVDQMQNHTFSSAGLEKVELALPSYRALNTSDGAVIGMIMQPPQLERFANILNHPELCEDPRFSDSAGILLHGDAIYDVVADTVAQMTTGEFIALMEKEQIPFGRVNTVEDFIESDEARSSEVFVELEDPDFGTVKILNHPVKYERTPVNVVKRAPMLGEHNEEIHRVLGKTPG
ncbi:hypothetical protein C1T17_17975 [Sphingobium sp. SCG-1]|uniref:CaiB/BaiF CoA transferase family protein n=1 Tax=Sphingobium sp. SCG-1 TaxID=2072936 RepID=UPI000CD6BCAC|nr:CoA transferase [Sphingobium sp. SCG-1]AUW59693.1 hypothetical protein C1T17_17975 [Sphingobium sp. SCG-1]